MLKLLKIRATGYKLLEDNFEVDFVTRARVMENDYSKNIFSVADGLNSFRSVAFVGGNASGKSTVLNLILDTCSFLTYGRFPNTNFINNNIINLEIDFYLNEKIYFYKGSFEKNFNSNIDSKNSFSMIKKEKIESMEYVPSKGKKNFLLKTELAKDVTHEILNKSLFDTSSITVLTNGEIYFDSFNTNNINGFDGGLIQESFFKSLNLCDKKLTNEIIHLLDDSIEYIEYFNDSMIKIKRFNQNEEIIPKTSLLSILSSGTFRGVELFIKAMEALRKGKILIVDEIENCFNKNLVFNLIYLFNSETTNINNAQLLFSTHYTEILDIIDRQDSIYITHKNNSKINIKNLKDYNIRTELTKSKQFDNNIFETSINYKQMMNVRRALIYELHSNND